MLEFVGDFELRLYDRAMRVSMPARRDPPPKKKNATRQGLLFLLLASLSPLRLRQQVGKDSQSFDFLHTTTVSRRHCGTVGDVRRRERSY